MMEPIRVLLIEDDPEDVLNVQQMLSHPTASARYEVCAAWRLSEGLERLAEEPFDVVLLDLMLPDSRGIATFLRVRAAKPEAPVLLLTGLDSESLSLEAVRLGAQDYLTKAALDGRLLARAIGYAMQRNRWVRDLERIIESSPDGMVVVDRTGLVRYLNAAAAALMGRAAEELLGRPFPWPMPAGGRPEEARVGQTVLELRSTELEWAKEPTLLVSVRDMTSARRVEGMRAELDHRRNVDRLKDQMIDALLAEFRGPLAAALESLETLRRERALAEDRLAPIRLALERLARLLGTLPERLSTGARSGRPNL